MSNDDSKGDIMFDDDSSEKHSQSTDGRVADSIRKWNWPIRPKSRTPIVFTQKKAERVYEDTTQGDLYGEPTSVMTFRGPDQVEQELTTAYAFIDEFGMNPQYSRAWYQLVIRVAEFLDPFNFYVLDKPYIIESTLVERLMQHLERYTIIPSDFEKAMRCQYHQGILSSRGHPSVMRYGCVDCEAEDMADKMDGGDDADDEMIGDDNMRSGSG
ncbi:hypothetical protein ABW20_dc0103333 [Dactylellina cionopaga]|nr:hypothetical protein ABW20_dc0103333 [Dactylellina cionopaga]